MLNQIYLNIRGDLILRLRLRSDEEKFDKVLRIFFILPKFVFMTSITYTVFSLFEYDRLCPQRGYLRSFMF